MRFKWNDRSNNYLPYTVPHWFQDTFHFHNQYQPLGNHSARLSKTPQHVAKGYVSCCWSVQQSPRKLDGHILAPVVRLLYHSLEMMGEFLSSGCHRPKSNLMKKIRQHKSFIFIQGIHEVYVLKRTCKSIQIWWLGISRL